MWRTVWLKYVRLSTLAGANAMNFIKKDTAIPGCYELLPNVHTDERGKFVKTFHLDDFESLGLRTDFKEEYFSVSRKGVLRGLHFQKPPHDHVKMVYCVEGNVFDAVLDLRKASPTYGKNISFELSGEKCNVLYLPKGVAHGFYTMSTSAIMMYKVTAVYSPGHDSGIMWNSAGIAWPCNSPAISERDSKFKNFLDIEDLRF